MSNSTLNVDPRIIPLVRSLKDQSIKPTNTNTNQDISSEKTSENSAKIKVIKEEKEDNKISEEKVTKKEEKKSKKNTNKNSNSNNIRLPGKYNTTIRKKSGTKISIDGSIDNKLKIKAGTSDNPNQRQRPVHHNSTNRIKIISKSKDQKFNPTSTFQIPTSLIKKNNNVNNYDYNRIKTRTKYVQNLLSDMNIKKYKQICIDLIKNDNAVKKLYEQAGLEKTNFSYENFIQNNFFNQPLFMYKLEMLFFDESNFIKKNFKENFFKNEMIKHLEQFTSQEIYKKQMSSLQDVFKDGFDCINKFDLFHD